MATSSLAGRQADGGSATGVSVARIREHLVEGSAPKGAEVVTADNYALKVQRLRAESPALAR